MFVLIICVCVIAVEFCWKQTACFLLPKYRTILMDLLMDNYLNCANYIIFFYLILIFSKQ